MSALLEPCPPQLQPMQMADVDEVVRIEQQCYEFPWTRGNIVDSLNSGYEAWLLRDEDGRVLGYFLAMLGVDEMHLLNIAVAPEAQGRGHAQTLLDALCQIARDKHCLQLWLEVRTSNVRARLLYQRYGFDEVGLRRAYYPAANQQREDAVLMSLALTELRP